MTVQPFLMAVLVLTFAHVSYNYLWSLKSVHVPDTSNMMYASKSFKLLLPKRKPEVLSSDLNRTAALCCKHRAAVQKLRSRL